MKKLAAVAALATLTLFYAPPGFAQPSKEFEALREEIGLLKETQALRRELEALKEGQRTMQKDLQDIKTLLQARPAGAPAAAPANPVISVDGAQFKGEKTAKLTLIEFSDFQ